MYFQYLIEDASTEILVGEVMKKLQDKYPGKKSFMTQNLLVVLDI